MTLYTLKYVKLLSLSFFTPRNSVPGHLSFPALLYSPFLLSSCTALFLVFFPVLASQKFLLPRSGLDDLLIPSFSLALLPHFDGARPSVTSLRRYTGGKNVKTEFLRTSPLYVCFSLVVWWTIELKWEIIFLLNLKSIALF